MRLRYAPKHRWLKQLPADFIENYGSSAQKQLRTSLEKIVEAEITHTIAPLTESDIDWFTPFYEANLASKDSAVIHDVYATTLGKHPKDTYFMLKTSERGVSRGAMIFAKREDRIATVYRTFERDWQESKLRANPALLSEYFLDSYAKECGYSKLSHGKDRNPYGLNAAIGLATFKLSIGCRPYCYETETEFRELDTDDVTSDVLVLAAPDSGNQITHAYLMVNETTRVKHEQVTKYPELLEVTVIERVS